ncbi:MAG: AAA family ATPase [Roseateles sp.]|uniref:AAA family ATPase n=1 Tax=Roseateles sp. TaxID=1971397 RepID=UPI0039E7DCB2
MRLEAGNVLAAKMNAHRHQWDGSICAQPQAWNCGAPATFRENYCADGVARCFHLDVFKPLGPRFVTPDPTVIQAVREQPRLLDDQVLVFYGGRFGSQQGITPGAFENALYGLYRVKDVVLDDSRLPHRLLIEPHPDDWAMLPRLELGPATLRSVPGVAYLKQLRARTLLETVDQALQDAATPRLEGWTPQHDRQLRRAQELLPQWLDRAEETLSSLPPPQAMQRTVVQAPALPSALADKLSKEISKVRVATVPARPAESPAPDPEPAPAALPEAQAAAALAERWDAALVTALKVGFATKSLVILSGAPGAGKSWIASRLLDDAERERAVIVPVASTWRGREDLLGYVNPINGQFEPTELTHFLLDAEAAWERGDRRARLVVFEEFNLSQPEHWLSDLLVRLEYEPERRAERTVALGGAAIAGRPGRACRVVLVPSLRFVATLNNDHTVKPLSPRVLDRAALIEVSSSGRVALQRAGLAVPDALADLIDDLNDLLAPRGAAFSLRSARSLQRAMAAGGLAAPQALDLVLAQEVLSRVRLLAGDPRDEQLLARLQDWSQRPECADLAACAARIAGWAEALASGRDVFQA